MEELPQEGPGERDSIKAPAAHIDLLFTAARQLYRHPSSAPLPSGKTPICTSSGRLGPTPKSTVPDFPGETEKQFRSIPRSPGLGYEAGS